MSLYSGVVFALKQGYICETIKDRENTIDILKYVYDNPEEYFKKSEQGDEGRRSIGDIINFKKTL